MKATDDKKKYVVASYEAGEKTVEELEDELVVTRSTIYRWLKSSGVKLSRRGTNLCGANTPLAKVRKKRGVSAPTARKYLAAQRHYEKEGYINREQLREVGITHAKIDMALCLIDQAGVKYSFERMTLGNKKLTAEQVIRLFLEPIEFLRNLK